MNRPFIINMYTRCQIVSKSKCIDVKFSKAVVITARYGWDMNQGLVSDLPIGVILSLRCSIWICYLNIHALSNNRYKPKVIGYWSILNKVLIKQRSNTYSSSWFSMGIFFIWLKKSGHFQRGNFTHIHALQAYNQTWLNPLQASGR